MKFRAAAVTVATVALSLAAAGSAAAQPLGHASQHEYASPPQLNGLQLRAALLPASAFGSNFTYLSGINSGAKLQTTHASRPVPGQSCEVYENDEYVSFLGDTAGAENQYMNTAWRASWPFAVYAVAQDVVQFATTAQAATYYGQAHAKYAQCLSFSVPNPGDDLPGGGTIVVSDVSVSKTTVAGHQAFAATELWAPSEATGRTARVNVLFVLAGTNVYNLFESSGTNDQPSAALMGDLIHRVQALYP
jgi:hypothetical protein